MEKIDRLRKNSKHPVVTIIKLFLLFSKQRESQKGQVELILTRELTETKDGTESRLVLSLSRLRCSLQMMHEQETLKGQLYIKMSVIEDGNVTQFWKSNRFPPSVSLKFAPEEAKVVADNPIDGVFKDASFLVKFTLKNKMGESPKFASGKDNRLQFSSLHLIIFQIILTQRFLGNFSSSCKFP